MIYDFYKNSGNKEATKDFRDLSTVQLKNDNVQAFDKRWDEELSAINERPTDNMLETLDKMQIEKSAKLKCALHVHAQDDIRGQEIRLWQIEVGGQRHLDQKTKISFHSKIKMRTDLQ